MHDTLKMNISLHRNGVQYIQDGWGFLTLESLNAPPIIIV